jgi:hypothetical protein
MNFSSALNELKNGKKLTRMSWKDRRKCGGSTFVFLVQDSMIEPDSHDFLKGNFKYREHLDMIYADESIGAWTPNNDDIFGTDWEIL